MTFHRGIALSAFALLLGTAPMHSSAEAATAVPASACGPQERGQLIGSVQVIPARYVRMTHIYAKSEGIPEEVLRQTAWHESSFCQQARSATGAIGVMQLMPATARELGVNPYKAHSNMAGGARYLRQLKKEFGTWPLALAAYNAGPGTVRRFGGVPPYPETQKYVRRISLAAGLELGPTFSVGFMLTPAR